MSHAVWWNTKVPGMDTTVGRDSASCRMDACVPPVADSDVRVQGWMNLAMTAQTDRQMFQVTVNWVLVLTAWNCMQTSPPMDVYCCRLRIKEAGSSGYPRVQSFPASNSLPKPVSREATVSSGECLQFMEMWSGSRAICMFKKPVMLQHCHEITCAILYFPFCLQ